MMNEARAAMREHGIEMEEEPKVWIEGSNFAFQLNGDTSVDVDDEDEDEDK